MINVVWPIFRFDEEGKGPILKTYFPLHNQIGLCNSEIFYIIVIGSFYCHDRSKYCTLYKT